MSIKALSKSSFINLKIALVKLNKIQTTATISAPPRISLITKNIGRVERFRD